MAAVTAEAAPTLGPLGRLSTFLYLRPRVMLLLLLVPPLLWLGVIYLGSLFALLAQSLFHIDDFSGLVVYEPGLQTYAELFTPANLSIITRTVMMSARLAASAACERKLFTGKLVMKRPAFSPGAVARFTASSRPSTPTAWTP